MKKLLYIFFIIFITSSSCTTKSKNSDLSYLEEISSIENFRINIESIITFLKNDKEITLKNKDTEIMTVAQKNNLRYLWSCFQDYYYVLNEIKENHRKFYSLNRYPVDFDDFMCYYFAFLTEYRYALELISILENNPDIDIILNEASKELNIPKNSYKYFKKHYLNISIATRFVAMNVIFREFQKHAPQQIEKYINADKSYIWKMGKGKGIILTIENSIDIIDKARFTLWYPIQKNLAYLASRIKVKRRGKYLISKKQIRTITKQLEPGDIFLERREWHLTNIGIPGFWTHSVLYIGLPEERDKFFNEDSATVCWVLSQGESSGNFDSLLKKDYPEAYKLCIKKQPDNNYARVIESLKEGVIFASIEKSANCDGITVLRPKLKTIEKAIAIYNSFSYLGRAYDYNFDFISDSTLLCTELIFKAYEENEFSKGLHFPISSIGGRKFVSVNNIAKQFSEQFESDSTQFDFILFYDGVEKMNKAVESDLTHFLSSWKRPKWHVFTQD